ncbi:putative quinol monooxygenase [Bradyrhizobium sp. TZ2]
MDTRQLFVLGASVLAAVLAVPATAQQSHRQYVQVAEIEIDPAQLEAYRAAAREQIETAIRVEPGVLVLYALSEKDAPTHVKVFEIYRDMDAYKSHLASEHFKNTKPRRRRWSSR